MRDTEGIHTFLNKRDLDKHDRVEEIKAELGDVLWYIANLASDLDVSLQHIAEENLAKLQRRKNRNTIQGSGDNR